MKDSTSNRTGENQAANSTEKQASCLHEVWFTVRFQILKMIKIKKRLKTIKESTQMRRIVLFQPCDQLILKYLFDMLHIICIQIIFY